MLDDRLFHTREAATGNARSPMVEWRVGGKTSVDVDADLRRRRESMSATLWSSSARYGDDDDDDDADDDDDDDGN